jgi:purine-binding chemotaxis protein CheW
MSITSQYVTLGVAEDLFAVPVERVQEILEPQSIARMPHAPADFLGIIDVRGEGVPVIDLRTRLGMPAAPDTENTRIIVLEVHLRGTMRKLGLKADRVFEVTSLDGDLEPPPEIGARWRADTVRGVGRRSGAIVTVFELDRLISMDEIALDRQAPADLVA